MVVIFCGVFGWFGLLLSDNRIMVCVFRHSVIQVKVKIVSSLNSKTKINPKSQRTEIRNRQCFPFSCLCLGIFCPKAKTKNTSKRKNAPSTAAFPDKAMDPMLSVCPTHSPMHSYVARSHSRAEWSLTKTRHSVSQNRPKIAPKSPKFAPQMA